MPKRKSSNSLRSKKNLRTNTRKRINTRKRRNTRKRINTRKRRNTRKKINIPSKNVQAGGGEESSEGANNYIEIYNEKIKPMIDQNMALLKERAEILRDMQYPTDQSSFDVPGTVLEGLAGLIYDQNKLLRKESLAHSELKAGKTPAPGIFES